MTMIVGYFAQTYGAHCLKTSSNIKSLYKFKDVMKMWSLRSSNFTAMVSGESLFPSESHFLLVIFLEVAIIFYVCFFFCLFFFFCWEVKIHRYIGMNSSRIIAYNIIGWMIFSTTCIFSDEKKFIA